ncbi:MAG: hypothetical protein LBR65_02840 [Culturomica sp.]|jgi:hypothetical protein|nr:hypothetical protein [Culturomica sp.]
MSNNSNDPNWLYILLTLAAVGIGLIRSVQKKFKDTEQPGPFPWEGEASSEEPEPPFWYEKPAKPDRKPFLEIEYVERPEYVPAEEKKEEKPIASDPVFSEFSEKEGEGSSEFDLKKAIIYSEILHRKYD